MTDKPTKLDDVAEETRVVGDQEERLPGPLGNMKAEPVPKTTQAWLAITKGPDKGNVFRIRKGLTVIGRLEDVAEVVVQTDVASRHHAVIRHLQGRFVLYDLGSTNGTKVNGLAIDSIKLKDGYDIEIGPVALTFRVGKVDAT